MNFSKTIITWYLSHKRDLPWRNTTNPYLIWLSEVVLQQTRVNQGMAYYKRLIERFPDIRSLADADEDELLKLWQGLGYYTRARNLHAAAKMIMTQYNGKFPATYKNIIALPGVGEYTAAAIASFAFNLAYPVVDGNVLRVLSRFLGTDIPINTGEGKKFFRECAIRLLDKENPGEYNQAIMEFGALQCTPKNPACVSCPLQKECVAFQTGMVSSLPVKKKGKAQQKRFFHYLVITGNKDKRSIVVLRKRNEQGIWKNLYDFPLIESGTSELIPDNDPVWTEWVESRKAVILDRSGIYTHHLSHQVITARFYLIQLENNELPLNGYKIVESTSLDRYPVPRLIDQFMIDYKHWLK